MDCSENDFQSSDSDEKVIPYDSEEDEFLDSDTIIDSSSSDDSFVKEDDGDNLSVDEDTSQYADDENDDNNLQDSSSVGNLFRRKLRNWALCFHITLVALTALLLILQTVVNFPLPLDARTLLGTIRHVKISKMNDGEYHHFGLDRAVKGIIREFNRKNQPIKEIKLMINMDGLPISNSGTDSLWLILCSEINGDIVYPIGAFCGKNKPDDANEFLKEFVDEITALCNNGLDDSDVEISCEAIICDAPAKSFCFHLKGHTGYESCPKCLIHGKYIPRKQKKKNGEEDKKNKKKKKGTVCFPGTGPFSDKTDEAFANNDYEDFDTGRQTILSSIPNFGCISNVPLDYMHLVLLGVMKKLIKLWVSGPLHIRLGGGKINRIDKKLRTLRRSIPSEFARKPRSMWVYRFWKATEFQTFLLYSGPVVLQNILSPEMYNNFILLHTAISVLINDIHLQDFSNIDACHNMLQQFVEGFQKTYGKEFVSHNVHNLLHISSDVKKYGCLDKYSSFRFENYMSTINRMIRKGDKPLQQIARRYSEQENAQKTLQPKETTFTDIHNTGPITRFCDNVKLQYKVLKSKSLKINCRESKDSMILFKDGRFGQVLNIVECHDDILLIVKEIVSIGTLYDDPDSRFINIHMGMVSKEGSFTISIKDILSKVWRVPSKRGIILLPLQHSCKL